MTHRLPYSVDKVLKSQIAEHIVEWGLEFSGESRTDVICVWYPSLSRLGDAKTIALWPGFILGHLEAHSGTGDVKPAVLIKDFSHVDR
jgi:hypothetical protein